MAGGALLQLQNVSRRLGGRVIVQDMTLALDRGCVLGLLGVNGAGKTTTLRMIAGVLAPNTGKVLFDGRELHEEPALSRRLGYLPETPPLYAELRVDEYLAFCARVRGLRGKAALTAVDGVVERCGLAEVRRRLCGNLSKGFAQRTGIAQAIIHDPDLIVLDEPASGLDPVQAVSIRKLVKELGSEHAVILSTHQLNDVTACCARVAIVHGGRLRYDGKLADLTGAQGGDLESVFLRIASADDAQAAA
ncbi:MAG: ABC transporter ATP-binding protein [Proteobacteria bacterium]|nr:ABC transporter ATP-binding protein [Pseudomonadota bacterium]